MGPKSQSCDWSITFQYNGRVAKYRDRVNASPKDGLSSMRSFSSHVDFWVEFCTFTRETAK